MHGRRALGWLLLGLGSGVLVSLLVAAQQPSQRVVVGGTGSTLSVVVLLARQVVIIGAGSSPNDGVELADRATLPWQRPYELLIVPGWDTEHVAGALGFVERRAVRSIVVIGLPNNDPAWTILERQAASRQIRFSVVTQAAQLVIGPDTELILYPTPRALFACLREGAVQVSIVDAAASEASVDPCKRPAAAIALRQTRRTTAPLLVRPKPLRSGDLVRSAPYEIAVGRGQRVRLHITPKEVRADLGVISLPESTPGVR